MVDSVIARLPSLILAIIIFFLFYLLSIVNSDLDKAIDKNLDATLVQNKLQKGVRYSVKRGVVTLTGEVNSQSKRAQVEKIASTVPNVQQVVNELPVKDQKASSMR